MNSTAALSLRRAGIKALAAVAARNAAIVEAHQAGATLREIGDAVGLSHVAVMKIVRRSVPPEVTQARH